MKKQDILNFTGLTEKEFYKEYKNPEDFFNSSLGKKFMAKSGSSINKNSLGNKISKAQYGNVASTMATWQASGGVDDAIEQMNNFAAGQSLNTANQVAAGLQNLSNFGQESNQEGKNRDVAKQRVRTLRPAYTAVQSTARENERIQKENLENLYYRPQAVTGEAFFPTMGVGKNGGTYKAQGGGTFTGEYMPLIDPNETKQFQGGGFVYGGGPAGQIGSSLGQMVAGENSNALGRLSGNVLGTAGMGLAGPIGGAVGQFIGKTIIGGLDKRVAETKRYNKQSNRLMNAITNTISGQDIHSGIASTKNGGSVSSYKNGGSEKMSSNPSMLDTMAMGGDVKTLWGGEVETVSYNPYAGGESIEFKGNSHNYRDPKTGQTGIGVAYGEQSVATNTPVVEVENEPAQKLRDGGGDENLVVYGDLKIPEEYVAEIGDDRAKGKKMKNYVSNILNKDEAKINKTMEKAAEMALETGNTKWDKLILSTAKVKEEGAKIKLKSIGKKKNTLADLQSALNETFDEFAIKGNEFITKNKIVEDPERAMNNMAKSGIEINPENKGKFTAWAKERGMSVTEAANKVMANTDEYSPGVVKMANFAKNARKFKKAQDGETITEDDFNRTPTTAKTPEQLKKEGYTQDPDNPLRFTKGTEEVIATPQSGSSLGRTPEGQSIDQETGLAGGITMEQISELEEENPWFGKFDFTKPKVKFRGKMVHPDVLRFQKEYNKRIEGSDIKPIQKIDGVLGQETFDARFTPGTEGKEATVDEVILEEPESTTTTSETTIAPIARLPLINFQRPIDDIPLDTNQLLGEYYAMATNQVQPVQAQGFQPQLRQPYEISLQDMKNDVVSQSRALQRNPVLQDNPAALALAQAPTYEALNKINAEEFRQNQQMKDTVYSGNIDALNKARMMNLGIYDKQADRQAQATANTRRQNIEILSSISNKYAQNKRDNAMRKLYANMYPNFRFDDNYQAQVAQGTQFNIPGQGNTGIGPFISGGGFGGGQTMQQLPGIIGGLQSIFGNQGQSDEEEESATAKYGKKVTKNNKNSNILKAIRNL